MRIVRKILYLSILSVIGAPFVVAQRVENTFSILSQENGQITLENSISNFSIDRIDPLSETYIRVNLGSSYTGLEEVGFPQLPLLVKLIEVPQGAKPTIIILEDSVSEYQISHFSEGSFVFPAQKHQFKKEKLSKFALNKELYERDEYWSPGLVTISEVGELAAVRLAKIKICPIEYNPKQGKLRIHHKLRIKLQFPGADEEKTELIRKSRNQNFDPVLSFNVVNYNCLAGKETSIHNRPPRYIIVSHTRFKEELIPFIEWKRKKGFEVVPLYLGEDKLGTTADSIRNYLKIKYMHATEEDPAASFLLLVGDVSLLPTFYRPSTFTASYPTDLYYAEYTGDIYPDVYFGRFPARNEWELANMIKKTIEYEQVDFSSKEGNSYLDNVLLVAGEESSYLAPIVTNGAIQYLSEQYLSKQEAVKRHIYRNDHSSQYTSEILNRYREGLSLSYYSGHGTVDYLQLSNEKKVGAKDILSVLPNDNHSYFFMINNACLTNRYDQANGFGLHLIRAESQGSIGVIGASSETLWEEDYYWACGVKPFSLSPLLDTNSLGAFDRMFSQKEDIGKYGFTQAQLVFAGNLAISQSESQYERYYWEIYCLLGDPSLQPFIGKPHPMAIELPRSIEYGEEKIYVKGTPGAYIVVFEKDVQIGTGSTNMDSLAVIFLDKQPTEAAFLSLLATKLFHKPYKGEIPLVSPKKAKLLLQSYDLYDPKDGSLHAHIADTQDSLFVGLRIVNVGQQDVQNMRLRIESMEENNCFFSRNEFHSNQILPAGQALITQQDSLVCRVKRRSNEKNLFKLILSYDSIQTERFFTIETFSPFIDIVSTYVKSKEVHEDTVFLALKFLMMNIGRDTAWNVQYEVVESERVRGVSSDRKKVEQMLPLSMAELEIQIAVHLSEIGEGDRYVMPISMRFTCDNNHSFLKEVRVPLEKMKEGFESGDFQAFAWEGSKLNKWEIEKDPAFVKSGLYSCRSAQIPDGKKSELMLRLNVVEDDSIRFCVKVSSERAYDYLEFLVDEDVLRRWSGEEDWQQVSLPMRSGEHTIRWKYTKDIEGKEGMDRAWIDEIEFPLQSSYTVVEKREQDEPRRMELYPNPTSGIVQFRRSEFIDNLEVYLYAFSGELVGQRSLDRRSTELDLSNLKNGLYFVVIREKDQFFFNKIIIVK